MSPRTFHSTLALLDRRDTRLASVTIAIAAAALFGPTSIAQAPPQPTFRTEANYVRVDVYPTKDGAPVPDLTPQDFEVLENGVPQKIDQFEHVVVRGNIAQETRREPNTVEESRQALQNPRARVMVVFLDVGHVDVTGSHQIRRPLIDALNRLVGEDDLVGIMTPEMSARDVAFARRTTTIEGFLTRNWPWGERDALVPRDPVEQEYERCYGMQTDSPLTREMIERRREKQTLDALEDLVVFLRGAREERKGILVISDGWRLFRPNPALEGAEQPTPPPIAVVPGTGRLAIGPRNTYGVALADCSRDRRNLAQLDDWQTFQRLLDEANRGNASFYPIDPRGLPVFDAPIGGPGSVPTRSLVADQAMLTARTETLRTIAEATDGLALVNSNDLDRSFRRIVDDLSSYYLLGYYSSGKLDGKFHPITVNVKRSGVRVRARRGYLAATPGASTAAAAAAAATAPVLDAAAAAATAAVATLAGFARDSALRVQAAAGPSGNGGVAVWVVGEVGGTPESREDWKTGGAADLELVDPSGASVARTSAPIAAGARSFRVALTPSSTAGAAAGEYVVRVSARPGSGATPSRDTVRLTAPAPGHAVGQIWIRRGPSTANREAPTADLRFRRNEQVRVEAVSGSSEAGSARLLDRTGKMLAVPVTTAVREDSDGTHWQAAQLALAPLAPGDYIVELSHGSERTLAPFRIVP